MKAEFQLQPNPSEIFELAQQYDYLDQATEELILRDIVPRVKEIGFLPYDDFLVVCEWKTKRSKSRVRKNSPSLVEETSRLAFKTKEESLRIGLFTLLKGVDYPTASVFLHFFHQDPYPILDFRALEAWGIRKRGNYHFDFWWRYVQQCRQLADKLKVDMRTLDKGLWQWSRKD